MGLLETLTISLCLNVTCPTENNTEGTYYYTTGYLLSILKNLNMSEPYLLCFCPSGHIIVAKYLVLNELLVLMTSYLFKLKSKCENEPTFSQRHI